MDRHRFVEEQRFRQPWLWAVMLVTSVVVVATYATGVYGQAIRGVPFGARPLSTPGLAIAGGLGIVVPLAVILLLWAARLTTSVDERGLFVRFAPFHRRPQQIDIDRVRSVASVTYSPLRDYGGWGIRYGFARKAYNVSGNRGVKLVYDDGSTLLIGSQQPDALAHAIERIRRG